MNQFGHPGHQPVQIDRLGIQCLTPRKGQQALGQGGRAVGCAHRRIQIARHHDGLFARLPGFRQFQAAGDAGEQVVEIMREAAGQLADRFHLLGLQQRLLRLAALGEFHRFRHDADDDAITVAYRAHLEIEPAPATHRQIDANLAPHGFALGDQRNGGTHFVSHAGRAGEPWRFPERPPDHLFQTGADVGQGGSIGVQQNSGPGS